MPVQSQLAAFHVMAKPTGAQCNLDCAYCFFLKKDRLYPGSAFRMSDEVMESYVRQTIQAAQPTIAWQGGEPTLMGLDFFRRVMAVEKKLLKMQRHQVEFNVLCTANAVNSRHPLEVYRCFRDELGARCIQSIPIVAREEARGSDESSVGPLAAGR